MVPWWPLSLRMVVAGHSWWLASLSLVFAWGWGCWYVGIPQLVHRCRCHRWQRHGTWEVSSEGKGAVESTVGLFTHLWLKTPDGDDVVHHQHQTTRPHVTSTLPGLLSLVMWRWQRPPDVVGGGGWVLVARCWWLGVGGWVLMAGHPDQWWWWLRKRSVWLIDDARLNVGKCRHLFRMVDAKPTYI